MKDGLKIHRDILFCFLTFQWKITEQISLGDFSLSAQSIQLSTDMHTANILYTTALFRHISKKSTAEERETKKTSKMQLYSIQAKFERGK